MRRVLRKALESGLARYAFAVVMVATAFGLRKLLEPVTGTGAPFVLFFAAVTVTAILAGRGPGICAMLLSVPIGAHIFVLRAGYARSEAAFQATLFAIDGLIVVYLSSLMTTARRAAESAEARVRDLIGMAPLAAQLERIQIDRHRPYLGQAALETRRPFLIERMTPERLESLAQSADHLRLLRAVGVRSVMAVPLQIREQLLGDFIFISSTPSRSYGLGDLRLAEALAERAALAIENGRLYRTAVRAKRVRDEVLGVVAHDLRNRRTGSPFLCSPVAAASESWG